MAAVFDQHFVSRGITQAQFRLLLAVWENGGEDGLAPSVLAGHLLLERATVSVLSTRMVERGLLARAPGENRRTFRLVLTETGRALMRDVLPHAVALADATLSGVEYADLSRVLALLETLEARLRENIPPAGTEN